MGKRRPARRRVPEDAPGPAGRVSYHARIYYDATSRPLAETARCVLRQRMASGDFPQLRFVGDMRDAGARTHPLSFEIHFTADAAPAMREFIRAAGLTALIRPLAGDVADPARRAEWIGTPPPLDLDPRGPSGRDRGVARLGLSGV